MNQPAENGKHYRIEPVGPGLYAAIHRPGGWGIGNAGIVDLGDATLVFDTGMTAAAGLELRQAAERLTGKPVSLVINSHYHNDHVWGNQAFAPNAAILASAETRQLLLTAGQEEVDHYQATSGGTLETLQDAYAAESDPEQRQAMAFAVSYYEALVASLPALEVRLPGVAFSERLDIHGTANSVRLLTFRNGHTGSDTILHAPAAGVVFAADLLFVDCHPYLADGDPHNLLTILDDLATLGADVLVPGHGPVGSPADLRMLQDYVRSCALVAGQLSEETEIDRAPVPEAYRDWELANFYAANLRYFWQRAQTT
jgi:glyoxylase-like metal-dependent hydrolase (beta-lactamase superfamily II)